MVKQDTCNDRGDWVFLMNAIFGKLQHMDMHDNYKRRKFGAIQPDTNGKNFFSSTKATQYSIHIPIT